MRKRKVQSIIFYLDDQNKKQFLLLKMNSGLWQSATGSVEEGEDYIQAALREAQEETALPSSNIKKVIPVPEMAHEFHSRWGDDIREEVFIIYCLKFWGITIDPIEHCDFKWISEDQLTRNSVHYESNFKALDYAKALTC